MIKPTVEERRCAANRPRRMEPRHGCNVATAKASAPMNREELEAPVFVGGARLADAGLGVGDGDGGTGHHAPGVVANGPEQ